jgi:two-component system, cell cycle response regulator
MIEAREALRVLLDLTRVLAEERPLESALTAVTDALLRLLPGEHASVRLLDETRTELIAGGRSGRGVNNAPLHFRRGEGVAGWVAEHADIARIDDAAHDVRFMPRRGQGFEVSSMLAVPLLSSGEVVGVLAVSSSLPNAYTVDDEVMARLVANCTVPPLEKARLARLTLTDPTTLAYNQRYLMPRLREEFERASRTGEALSILFVDLDHFKDVNDTWGHAVGDIVLRAFADRVRPVVRRYDVLVRRGGDEFVLIMPGGTIAEACDVAGRMRAAMSDVPIVAGDGVSIKQTVSIGAAEWNRLELPDGLDRRADAAMYEAKSGGRDRVVVASAEPRA